MKNEGFKMFGFTDWLSPNKKDKTISKPLESLKNDEVKVIQEKNRRKKNKIRPENIPPNGQRVPRFKVLSPEQMEQKKVEKARSALARYYENKGHKKNSEINEILSNLGHPLNPLSPNFVGFPGDHGGGRGDYHNDRYTSNYSTSSHCSSRSGFDHSSSNDRCSGSPGGSWSDD